MMYGNEVYFSIVIPVFNRERTLNRCIDSILAQTYPNFELICVDDNSTDSSWSVLESYAKKDERIKIFRQEQGKKGAQSARKIGIVKSSYDWIMFNDSDDVWYEDKISLELAELRKRNFNYQTVIYSNCNVLNENSNKTSFWKLPKIEGKKSYQQLLFNSAPMFQSLCCSKSLLSSFDYIDENVPAYQEWDTSLALAKNCGRFVYIRKPTFLYYVGNNDAISASTKKDFLGRLYIFNKYKSDIEKYIGKKGINRQINYLIHSLTCDSSSFGELYENTKVKDFLFQFLNECKAETDKKIVLNFLRILKRIFRM